MDPVEIALFALEYSVIPKRIRDALRRLLERIEALEKERDDALRKVARIEAELASMRDGRYR